MDSSSTDPRRLLAEVLKGQVVKIPNLHGLFQGWPEDISTDVDVLRRDVEERLNSTFPAGEYLEKLKAADAGLFGASWWPYAQLDALRTATYLSIWLFAWDDETDSLQFSDLGSDFERGQAFRAATIAYVRWCLGLADEAAVYQILALSPHVANFKSIGDSMMERCSLDQRRLLLNEIEFFVEMQEHEQRIQLSGKLPTVEEYKRRRMGTSAVGVCLAITEFAFDMELPPGLMSNPDMRQLWDETNVIISTVNDMLSVHKEVAQGQVDSLIPLLYRECGNDAQRAIDTAFTYAHTAVLGFDEAAERLLDRTANDTGLCALVSRFIDGCRYACTANLNWSFRSGRYDLSCETVVGGQAIMI